MRVAPFKAQNMSLNSYPCREGGEIGRAQVVQAEACELEPSADMNPILLKPNSITASQVVLNGRVWKTIEARDYYRHFDELLGHVLAAYARLSASYDFIVVEGAGSLSEVNFRDTDLVNLGLATRLGIPALLVADIDRGGVFASVVGTFAVLEPAERECIRAFAINKFRGDPGLFAGAAGFLEQRTSRPCLGVFPYLDDVRIDEEDSVALEEPQQASAHAPVAILGFPQTSNFTDFQNIPAAVWLREPVERRFDTVILPGSKNTLADLAWMRARGLDRWVLDQHAAGARIIGICGGYQMMGEHIADPEGVESESGEAREAAGLGLLPVRTVLEDEKTTRVVEARLPNGHRFRGYEIHLGRTERPAGAEPFAWVNQTPEGIRRGRAVGTYLHGALEDAGVMADLLGLTATGRDKMAHYGRLADWFEQHVDWPRFAELFL